MGDVKLTRQLLREGYESSAIAGRVRRGELFRLRRGAYATDEVAGRESDLRLIEATISQADTDVVISHLSAAAVHGLPYYRVRPHRVHLTRPGGTSGGNIRGPVHVHVAPLSAADRTMIDGLPVTSLARTTVDVARTLGFRRGVAVADAALAAGMSPDLLLQTVDTLAGFRGIAMARRVAWFADGRSESAGESESRAVLADAGVPEPDLQYEVFDAGELVARCDYVWREHRTLGEFDGLVKYGRLLKPGQTAADVVVAEKLREDRLRDLGWQVVRWIYADLAQPQPLSTRIRRAFRRASLSTNAAV